VHLALEQLRIEEVFNDDGSFMLWSIASHFLGPPVKQSYRQGKKKGNFSQCDWNN
jgi:hypothetical protein